MARTAAFAGAGHEVGVSVNPGWYNGRAALEASQPAATICGAALADAEARGTTP